MTITLRNVKGSPLTFDELDNNFTDLDSRNNTATTDIETVTTIVDTHIATALAAHDAGAIEVTPAGGITSTDVQAALEELDAEISGISGASGPITSSAFTVSTTDRVLGRQSAGSGAIEEIVCTSAGRALIDDVSAAAQRTTLGLVIGTDVQAYDANYVKKTVANTFTAVQSAFASTSSVSTTSTFTYDPSTHGQVCEVTLTNAITVTLAASAGKFVTGNAYTLIFKAGDTSSRTFAKASTVLAASAALPITSAGTTNGTRDVFHFIAVDANTIMVVGTQADVR